MNEQIKSYLREKRNKLRYYKDLCLLYFFKGKKSNSNDASRIFLIGTEDFGNIGDHHIALSIIGFLHKNFNEKEIVEVTASEYYKKRPWLIRNIKKNDIIIMTGGGNFGNTYIVAQLIRRDIIEFWKQNFKLVMPVTVYYENSDDGKKQLEIDKTFFTKENNIVLITREKKSFDFASQQFECEIILTPDIVLSSSYDESKHRKKTVLFCIRNDKESTIDNSEKKRMKTVLLKFYDSIEEYDTQKDYCISKVERAQEVDKCIKSFQSVSLVVTDRLHGMIFAVITGTPCIVFGNYNHKVRDSFEWIKGIKSVRFVDDALEFENIVSNMIGEDCKKYDPSIFSGFYDKIKKIIMERLK